VTVVSGIFVSYAWDFGDGTLGAGDVVTHTYGRWHVYGRGDRHQQVNTMTASTTVTITPPSGWHFYLPVVMKPWAEIPARRKSDNGPPLF
jgi:Zn-dependent protease